MKQFLEELQTLCYKHNTVILSGRIDSHTSLSCIFTVIKPGEGHLDLHSIDAYSIRFATAPKNMSPPKF